MLCHGSASKILGSLVHVALAYVGYGDESDHFESYVHNFFLHFYMRLFLGLELMTLYSQGNNFTAILELPFVDRIINKKKIKM
jgi:hypothetical protein